MFYEAGFAQFQNNCSLFIYLFLIIKTIVLYVLINIENLLMFKNMFLILYKKIGIYLLPFFGSFIYPLEKVEDLMSKSSCQRCSLFGQF